jgi:regulatory protein
MKNSALNYALWLLGRRDRSIGEIREKLLNKGHNPIETEAAIKFLIDKGFLSDERFAKSYIQNQLSLKPLGKYQLKIKLQKKLVPAEIIEQALAEDDSDESELAEIAFGRWIKKNLSKEKKYEKVCRHLLSRGFNWETVKEILAKNKKLLESTIN